MAKPTGLARAPANALDIAFSRAGNVIHRPDRGSQYTSVSFDNRCDEASVRASTGAVDDACDNAICKSFFATLQCGSIDHYRFRPPIDSRMAVFRFIEDFYNSSRRHVVPGYLAHIEYQRRHDGLTKPS